MITCEIVTFRPDFRSIPPPKTGDSGHFGQAGSVFRARPPWVSLATPWVSLAWVSLVAATPWVSLAMIDTGRITRHISSTAEAWSLAETRET